MAEQKSRVPRLVAGVDLRSLPLTPLEGFVLSRVDGAASVGDIADLTSLELAMVLATVEKLIVLDAVEWADGATGLPKPSVRPPAGTSRPPAEKTSRSFAPPPVRGGRDDLGIPVSALVPPRAPSLDPQSLEPLPLEPGPADPTPSPARRVVPPPPQPIDLPPLEMAPEPMQPALPPLEMAPPDSTVAPSERAPEAVTSPSAGHAVRERPAGMHVYSARHGSEPPVIETVDQHIPHERKRSPAPSAQAHTPHMKAPSSRSGAQGSHRPSTRPPSSSQPSVRPPTITRSSSRPVLTRPGDGPAAKAPSTSAPAAPPSAAAPVEPARRAAGPEENDLPEEKRKKIDELYVIVDLLDHYQVLGVERDADRARIKASYFELSKQFHPDTAFRKNVGPYRAKMEIVFKRLTEAYDVLSKKKAREDYDAYLKRSEQSQEFEQTLSDQHKLESAMAQIEAAEARQQELVAEQSKRAQDAKRAEETRRAENTKWAAETQRADEERRAEERRRAAMAAAPAREPTPPERIGTASAPAVFSPRSGTSPGNRPSSQGFAAAPRQATSAGVGPGARPMTSPGGTAGPSATGSAPGADRPLMTEEAKRRAKELLTRRLDGGRPQPAPAAPSPPPPAAMTKEGMIRTLATSLMGAATITGGLDPIQRHVAEAKRSLADGKTVEAVRQLRLAAALAPDDPEIKAFHDKVARDLAASLADNYAEQAAYEERHQKWAAAAISWQRVVDGRPNDPDCHWRGARALLESGGGDLKQAVRLAQRAVELAPQNVFAVRVLGRAFMSAGMTLNAKRELERAVALDPKDDATKALLKELKSG